MDGGELSIQLGEVAIEGGGVVGAALLNECHEVGAALGGVELLGLEIGNLLALFAPDGGGEIVGNDAGLGDELGIYGEGSKGIQGGLLKGFFAGARNALVAAYIVALLAMHILPGAVAQHGLAAYTADNQPLQEKTGTGILTAAEALVFIAELACGVPGFLINDSGHAAGDPDDLTIGLQLGG